MRGDDDDDDDDLRCCWGQSSGIGAGMGEMTRIQRFRDQCGMRGQSLIRINLTFCPIKQNASHVPRAV